MPETQSKTRWPYFHFDCLGDSRVCVCVCVGACVCTRKTERESRRWRKREKGMMDRQKEGETERELLTYSYCKSQMELNLYRRAKSPSFFTVSTLLRQCVCVRVYTYVMGGLALVDSLQNRTHTHLCRARTHSYIHAWISFTAEKGRFLDFISFLQRAHTYVTVSAYQMHMHTHTHTHTFSFLCSPFSSGIQLTRAYTQMHRCAQETYMNSHKDIFIHT